VQLPFPAWPDPTGSAADRLNHRIDPSLYIVGKWGEVRYAGDLPGAQLGRMVAMLAKETEGSDRQFFTSRGVDVGCLAPEFTLSDLEGRSVGLKSLLGSASLLCLVFAGSDLANGTAATPKLVQLGDAFAASGLRVALIYSFLAPSQVREAHGHGSGFTILVDESGEVARTYQLGEPPLLFLIGVHGLIRYRGSSLSDVASLAGEPQLRARPAPPAGHNPLPP
jgi:peroxiredoxin